MCTGKHRHETLAAAKRQLNKKQADKFVRFGGTGEKLSPYRCPFCKGFHIGKSPTVKEKKKEKYMSLDDKAEQDAYDALQAIAAIPRPKERVRICLEVIRIAAAIAGFEVENVEGIQNGGN